MTGPTWGSTMLVDGRLEPKLAMLQTLLKYGEEKTGQLDVAVRKHPNLSNWSFEIEPKVGSRIRESRTVK